MMKSLLCAGVAACAITAVASADVTYDFAAFTAAGGEFTEIFAAGTLTGTLTAVGIDVVLVGAGGNFTWADDLTIAVGPDPLLLQAGGFSNYGALERISWSNGGSGDDGTPCVDTQALATPIDMASEAVLLGNGYNSGGATTWAGFITLFGVDIVPAPGALALMGVAGLAGSRRRRD
jgi:hypothetical protein